MRNSQFILLIFLFLQANLYAQEQPCPPSGAGSQDGPFGGSSLLDDLIDYIYDIPILRALDPNDITGPTGYGEGRWVSVNDRLDYRIRFENDPDFATGAARNVLVNLPIHVGAERNTFRVGGYGFGPFVFASPDNRSYYETSLDVSDSLGVLVNFIGGLDVVKEKGFWVFQSVDPITNLEPTNANLGFLPVNDTLTGSGEGFVNYSIQPNRTAQTGDTIFAQAEIIFDQESPIATNTAFNLIDADLPISQITKMEVNPADSSLLVTINASDVGSGLDQVELFYARNSGPLQLWERTGTSDTTFRFIGQRDSTYCFVTVATDHTGNIEGLKSFDSQCYTFGSAFAPILASFTPDSAYVGDTVTIAGLYLTGTDSVAFNGFYTTEVTVVSDSLLTVVVPTDATNGRLTVARDGQTATSQTDFTVLFAPIVPQITDFTPKSDTVGAVVTIKGQHFNKVTGVEFFNGIQADFQLVNDSTITVIVPENVQNGPIKLLYAGGSVSSAESFQLKSTTALPDAWLRQLVIYPNPGKGMFYVQMPALPPYRADFEVFDALGKLVTSGNLVHSESEAQIVDLTRSPIGMYFLHLYTEKGNYVQKLVRE